MPSRTRLALGGFVTMAVLLIGGAVPAFSSPASAGQGGAMRRVVPLLVRDPAAYRQGKAAAEHRYELWRQRKGLPRTSVAAAPLTSVFNGLDAPGITDAASTDSTPSDSTGAIGPSNYVEFINSEIAVYDNTDLSASPATLDESTFVGDPTASTCDVQIQWDEPAQRWLYAALDCDYPFNTGAQALYFGWSKTASPDLSASNWCRYTDSTQDSLEDYPKLGHDDTQIIIGTNGFDDVSGAYTASHIFVFDKPANLSTTCPSASTELGSSKLQTDAAGFTPVPANLADSSATGYVVDTAFDQAHLHLYAIGRSGGANAVLGTTSVAVPGFDLPAPVPQPGTDDVIDSLDARLTQAVAVTDPAVGEEGIWTQHTIAGSGGGPSVVRWYELTPGATTPRQTGTVSGPNGSFAFNAAISPAADGTDVGLFYESGSATHLVDMRARDRHGLTPAGSMIEDLQLATSSFEDSDFSCPSWGGGPACRWGDYAGASPDPSHSCVVWGTTMLTPDPPDTDFGTPQWGTQNAAIDTCPAATYALSVVKAGSGSGTVGSSPSGISCGGTCSHDFAYGASVTLTATPVAGSSFAGWSGACSGTGACSVTIGQDESVTATFTLTPETLTVGKSGTGSGTVTSNIAGISCGSACSHAYGYGTSVTLTATPATGSSFAGWSGACSGTGICTVEMSQARAVVATFSLLSETLTVAKSGSGSGTVGSSPAGISCGSTCSHAYSYGTSVNLTASAGAGSVFTGWSGVCSGTSVCTITMSQAQSLTASFARAPACVVPKLKGKRLRAAKRALGRAHCRPGKITRRYSKARKGRVIAQRPKPRTQLRVGARVKLVVSRGRKP